MKETTRSTYASAVRGAVERILSRLDEALDLGALARVAALSPLHFHHVFRGMVGETPLELHRRLRIERAAFQLATTEHAVTRIALDAGYETHEAFTRAFRASFAVAPSGFRQRALTSHDRRARFELAARNGVHFVPDATRPSPLLLRGPSTMNVTIELMPELHLATVAHVGPYDRISEAFARLGAIVGRAGLVWDASTAMVAVYYDDPEATAPDQLRSEAAVTLPRERAVPEGLGVLRLPAGRYARFTHVGPYSRLGDAWARLMGEWLPESGERIGAGHGYEIYRNTPETTPESELCTGLYLPLA